jgi:hypothetical protein
VMVFVFSSYGKKDMKIRKGSEVQEIWQQFQL